MSKVYGRSRRQELSDVNFSKAKPDPQTIYLACGASDEYAAHLAVTLHSALRHIDRTRQVHVCVMDGGIASKKLARVRSGLAAAHPRVTIDFIRPNLKPIRGLPTTDRYPPSVYFRLLMPFVLPNFVESVLYLDADIVVTEDVSPLFDFDLEAAPLWAVRDPGGTNGVERLRQDFPGLSLPKDMDYFNGGVMLINLPEWRRQRVSERVIDLIGKCGDRFSYFEQDAMNIVMAKNWGQLHLRWNNIIQGRSQRFPKTPDWNGSDGILHFAGRRFKPWHWSGRCLHEDTYRSALLASGVLDTRGRLVMDAYRNAKWLRGRLGRMRNMVLGRSGA